MNDPGQTHSKFHACHSGAEAVENRDRRRKEGKDALALKLDHSSDIDKDG